MKLALLLAAPVLDFAAAAVPTYELDDSWKPEYPEQACPKGECPHFSAIGVSGDEVFMSTRGPYSQPVMVYDKHTGKHLRDFGKDDIGRLSHGGHTWGGHGLKVQPANASAGRPEDLVWVTDAAKHMIHSFYKNGTKLGESGQPGKGLEGLGCPSDLAFHEGIVYIGDEGVEGGAGQNRVDAWEASKGYPEKALWNSAQGQLGVAPHGITFHEASGKILVADRDICRIAVMDPNTRKVEENLPAAGLKFQAGCHNHMKAPSPYDLRSVKTADWDLLFVIGQVSTFSVVDMSSFASEKKATVIQQVKLEGLGCETLHQMSVDHENMDIYISCLNTGTRPTLRLRQKHSINSVLV